MSVEMDDLYAQIRAAMAKATEASDVMVAEFYRTGIITDQSDTAREFIKCYSEYKDLLNQAVLLEDTNRG